MFIKPIETSYAGHRFRSRLEARWAVAFDALAEPWQYECQGYEVGPESNRHRYLPDFYLPHRKIWVEVKGSDDALGDSWRKFNAATHPTCGLPKSPAGDSTEPAGRDGRLLLLGPVPEPTEVDLGIRSSFLVFGCHDRRQCVWHSDLVGNQGQPQAFVVHEGDAICFPAGTLDLTPPPLYMWRRDLAARDAESLRINHALVTARSARFEFGEKPSVRPWREGESGPDGSW